MVKKLNFKSWRLWIILGNIAAVLSFFPITISEFAYGISDATLLYITLYPLKIISTVLIISNIRLGYFISLLVCLVYSILLTNEVGHYIIFDNDNFALFWVLLIPYLISLSLITLILNFLFNNRILKVTAAFIPLSLLIYSIGYRYNCDYTEQIFVDAELTNEGKAILTCKPGFADSRTFTVTTNSMEFIDQVKAHGEFYQGSYFLQNTTVRKNFNFGKLRSITLTEIGDNKLDPQINWKAEEINGNTEFLIP